MLEKLKRLKLDAMLTLDEPIELYAYARQLETGYVENDIEVPEWLTAGLETLREDISVRRRNAAIAEMRDLEASIEGFKTQNEKKADAQRRLAKLQKLVGLTSKAKA